LPEPQAARSTARASARSVLRVMFHIDEAPLAC
jgi:hypothetical protein